MINELTINKIKEAASIVDVIGDFYDLKKSGVEYECKCPFHEDRHIGSFKISPKKNYAKCFSCGWQGGPIDFLMEHERLSFADALRWLGKKYSIEVEGSEQFTPRPSVPRQQVPPLPMLTLPMWMVYARQTTTDNTLIRWIKRGINWCGAQRARIDSVLKDYHVGTDRWGRTIFWQIDEQQRVRTGKMMLYQPNGHRDKDTPRNFDWVHSSLFRNPKSAYSADEYDAKPCLFGLHLLDKYKLSNIQQDICIVESEKTALLMAIAYGNSCNQVWMACGGLENLNRQKLITIIAQRRNIRLYPDRDAIDRWKIKAEQLNYNRLIVATEPVTKWWQPEDGDKADIADVVVRILNNKIKTKT